MASDNSRHQTLSRRARQWRRNNRRRFNRLLARLLGGAQHPRRAPLAADTNRILIVRLNKRLGNVLFLTPMLQSLAHTLPDARIDIVIQSQSQAALLETLPGVGRIWVQKSRLIALLNLLRAIRREKYDLAIDPTGNSASNRIGMALSGARQRLAFANVDQWLPLTHAAGRPTSRHQAVQAVELLADAIAAPAVIRFDRLAVFPDTVARDAAARQWQTILGTQATGTPVIGFFARATGAKMLPTRWWQDWLDALSDIVPAAVALEILPSADAAPIDARRPHVAIASLTELAAFMARCDQFVAADSGPMHLAAAAGVPVVGLFNATSPRDYAPLGRDCISLEDTQLDPAFVARTLATRLPDAGT